MVEGGEKRKDAQVWHEKPLPRSFMSILRTMEKLTVNYVREFFVIKVWWRMWLYMTLPLFSSTHILPLIMYVYDEGLIVIIILKG